MSGSLTFATATLEDQQVSVTSTKTKRPVLGNSACFELETVLDLAVVAGTERGWHTGKGGGGIKR